MVTRIHLNYQVSSYRFTVLHLTGLTGLLKKCVFSKVAILPNVSFTVSAFHVQFVKKVNIVYLMQELFNKDVEYKYHLSISITLF